MTNFNFGRLMGRGMENGGNRAGLRNGCGMGAGMGAGMGNGFRRCMGRGRGLVRGNGQCRLATTDRPLFQNLSQENEELDSNLVRSRISRLESFIENIRQQIAEIKSRL